MGDCGQSESRLRGRSSSDRASGSDRDLFVRAYDAVSGDVEWEISRQGVSVTTIRLDSGRLLVGGAAADATYLAAISTKNGVFLWQDATPTSEFVIDIAASGPRITAAIVGENPRYRRDALTLRQSTDRFRRTDSPKRLQHNCLIRPGQTGAAWRRTFRPSQ